MRLAPSQSQSAALPRIDGDARFNQRLTRQDDLKLPLCASARGGKESVWPVRTGGRRNSVVLTGEQLAWLSSFTGIDLGDVSTPSSTIRSGEALGAVATSDEPPVVREVRVLIDVI